MSLQGTIETFAIGDVLRLLAATSKSGRLQVQGPDRSGTVWVDGGKVLAAESPSTPFADKVPDVLFQLVRFERGSFSFELDRHPPQPGEPVDIEAALGEAESMVSEWREIERRVPSSSAWVGLRGELPNESVTVSAEQWKVVRAVGGGRSVSDVGDALGLSELPALRAVDQLLSLGLVDVGDAPAETGSDGATTFTAEATPTASPGTGAGPEAGSSSGGATLIGDTASVSAPSPLPEGEARRRLDAMAGAYGLPTPPPATESAATLPSPAPALTPIGDEPAAEAPEGTGATPDIFPTDTHAGAAPHGDPLVGSGPGAETGRANPPAPPGYDSGGYGQSSYSPYEQSAYAAYGEYGQQAQPGYGDAGQSPLGGYGTPPPAPSGFGAGAGAEGGYYGDSARSESPTAPPADQSQGQSWAPASPASSLAPDWTSPGRSESDTTATPTAEAGGGDAGWPTEGVGGSRSMFESMAPPPPPPPPAPSGTGLGSGSQWYDSGPERLAPPPPPPPPLGGSGNGTDRSASEAAGNAEGRSGGSDDEAASLEKQLQHLSPKAQEAIKRSSGLFEGRSPR